jgi:hypothetical protein
MIDTMHRTFRVAKDGSITVGMDVPHKARDGERHVAAPLRHARNERRFAGLSMIPTGVDQQTTLPHDCANHLPGGDNDR